jgi:hypothetical protein
MAAGGTVRDRRDGALLFPSRVARDYSAGDR